MKNMLLIIGLALAAATLLLTGCEWTAGGGVESWDDSVNWADFSGVYSAPDNGILVREFAYDSSTNSVSDETLDTANGTSTVFSGMLGHIPMAGSVTITAGAYLFRESGSSSNAAGTVNLTPNYGDGSAGTLNYQSRVWSLQFPAPLAAGTRIHANYLYTDISTGQGSHGRAIYSFTVFQQGNVLQITDSNGTVYRGNMGAVRTTGGGEADSTNPPNGPVVGQFSATGFSQGYNVTIVGTLNGTRSGTSFSDRNMQATYMEEGGYQSEIIGVAPVTTITTTTTH